jgi:hypothetical protein
MTAPEALAFLARERRTVLLGGAAVILHGMNRSTKDFDIWMDPHPDADTWAAPIAHLLGQDPSLSLLRISPLPQLWNPITKEKLPVVANEDRLIRIAGTNRPIDVFYIPNELEAADFEGVWQRGKPLEHGIRLMEEIDLIVTKQLTNRPNDRTDIRFLQDKIEAAYRDRLRTCSAEEAQEMLARFATPEIAAFAVKEASDADVRSLGWKLLNEMREAGDPFAEDLIREIDPPSQSRGIKP